MIKLSSLITRTAIKKLFYQFVILLLHKTRSHDLLRSFLMKSTYIKTCNQQFFVFFYLLEATYSINMT